MHDARKKLSEHSRAALFGLIDIVEIRTDEVEWAEQGIVEPIAHTVSVDHPIEELFRGSVNPALLVDRAIDERARLLIQHAVGGHPIELGSRREEQALAVF